MVESAALLVDEVLPAKPIRQWVLTVPFPLRFLFAAYPELMSRVLGIVTRAISTHLAHQAGLSRRGAHVGAVTLIQRFGSALNLNIHFHMLFVDGVYLPAAAGPPVFRHLPGRFRSATKQANSRASTGAWVRRSIRPPIQPGRRRRITWR